MFSIAMSYIICGYEPWEQRLLAIEFWLTGEKYFPNWEKNLTGEQGKGGLWRDKA